jgi:uncharacterized repeat protein (TIGR03803 family)
MRRVWFSLLALLIFLAPAAQSQTTPTDLYDNPPSDVCWTQASDGNLYGQGYTFNLTTATPTAFPLLGCNFFQATDGSFYGDNGASIVRITLAGASTTVHTFSNSDGGGATAMLQGNDGNFYGVSASGGAYGYGTLFTFTSSGGFKKLYDFTNGDDGAHPATLIQASDGNLYGSGTSLFRATLAGVVTPLATSASVTSLTEGPDQLLYGYSDANQGTFESISLTGTVTPLAVGNESGLQFGFQGPCFLDGASNFYCSAEVVDENDTGDPDIYGVYSAAGNPLDGYLLGVPGSFSGSFSASYSQAGDGSLYGQFVGGGNGTCGDPCGGPSYDYLYSIQGGTTAPIAIRFSPASVQPGQSTTLTWSANNAFSDTMQQCFASGSWSGTKAASGSASITAPSTPGSYRYALTCGGVETAAATLAVGISTITLQPSYTVFAAGTNLTLSATVAGTGPIPTGKVNFLYGSQVLGSASLNGSGVANFNVSTTGITPGTYNIKAQYLGSSNYTASTSASVALRVLAEKAGVTIFIDSATPNPVPKGKTITLLGYVEPNSYSQYPSGTVTFTVGSTLLGTVPLNGSGTFAQVSLTASTSGVPLGTYPVVMNYSGNAEYAAASSAPQSVTVIAANDPAIALMASPNPVDPPGSVTLTATVTGSEGVAAPTGTVSFMYGTAVLGSSSLNGSGVAKLSASTTGLAAGTYDITASYGGDNNYVPNSVTVAVTVQ